MNSCCCSTAGRPGLEGQSILATVAIQAPLKSRFGDCACAEKMNEKHAKREKMTLNIVND